MKSILASSFLPLSMMLVYIPYISGVARVASLGVQKGCSRGKEGAKSVWPG